jgi:hypothetical protein
VKVKELREWLATRDPEDEIDVEVAIAPSDGRWHWADFFAITELSPDDNTLAVDIEAGSVAIADLHEELVFDCDCHVKEGAA